MNEPRLQRRLAAIVIADVVGYSCLIGSDEAGTLRAVTERRRSIVEPVVAAHAGRIVKTMGDGFFLEFGSAVDAVEAALELQAQMAQANAGLPEARQMLLRIGINLGEVIVEDGDLFGDGVTEDLITELSRWRVLTVRSRSASFRYRGQALDTAQVARELDVRYLVEGSVRRIGERTRINVQLVDCDTGTEVWAEKYDRPAKDLFAVQDEAVKTIVSTLVGRVNVSDVARARRKPPSSLAAYDCVERGNALPWGTPEGLAEAAQMFERAVEIDPDYGFAIALLAWIRHAQWFEDSSGSSALLDEAQSLAERAVQVDENQSSSFSILAGVNLSRRAFDTALQHLEHALVLDPADAAKQLESYRMAGLPE